MSPPGYILNDDFDGGTWVDPTGNTHSGSSGIAGALPSSSIWQVQTPTVGQNGNYGGWNTLYTNNPNVIAQDGAGNLVLSIGLQNTWGASSNLYPAGACSTGSSTYEFSSGTPLYAVYPGQSCEVRVKTNPMSGVWPSVWFEGADGVWGTSTYAEIDMMECGDNQGNVPGQSTETVWGGDRKSVV